MRNYVIPPNHEGGYVYTRGYSHQGDERGSQILQIVIISLLIIFCAQLAIQPLVLASGVVIQAVHHV
ncbi:TPA: hypothetical protein JEX81_001675 [Escherichia coli]|nr:hypothetical protein [Escherichia coli]